MNDIMKLKIELENKKKDNEKLKNIILKYKESRSYRAISNPNKILNENLSFVFNGQDWIVCKDIPKNQPLYPFFSLNDNEQSVELIE